MKKTILIVLSLSLLLVLSSSFVQGGKKFTSSDGKLSFKLPAPYEVVETIKDDGSTTSKVSCELEGTLYMLTWTKHIYPMDKDMGLTDISLKAFNETIGGEILEQSEFDYDGYKGIEALMEAKGTGYFRYRVLLIKQIQFQLVVASVENNIGKKATKFFNSFKYDS